MKKSLAITTIVLLFALYHFTHLKVVEKRVGENNTQTNKEYAVTIADGLKLLMPANMADLRVDEYFLLKKINEKKTLTNLNLPALKKNFDNDPFKKLADKNDFTPYIKIEKKAVLDAIGKNFDGNFYSIKNTGGTFGVWNDILVKALYCNQTGYDDQDFFILKLMRKQDGGYLDTHFLLALLLLKENGCYKQQNIEEQISLVSNDILNAAAADQTFSDLYAERIVFLYWAGYNNTIKKEWMDLIKNSFKKDTGWTDAQKPVFSVHVNGLALLSLLYFTEGKNTQLIYQ